jgi:alpha-glucosidase
MGRQPWYYGGVIYQIYPRSFQDSNHDGVGDLPGILRRLDYLRWLGVDAIWLSPVFRSPMVDFGYDVADYTAIDPLFGTLDDFDVLVAEAHVRDMRVILDFVPNHTSDQHPWFIESRASRDNPRRDWYIWQDARADGSPPNNWRSEFGGSAWEWDAHTEQYYLHTFAVGQPELNWRNPDVVAAMCDVMRFWLDRGVDGFRVDVIHQLLKDDRLRDDPPNPLFDPDTDNPYDALLHTHSSYQPEVHDLVRLLRRVIDEYDDRVLIGEIHYYAALSDMRAFYGQDDEVHLPFNFWLTLLDWDLSALRSFVAAYEASLPPFAFPNYVLGNHDVSRAASRIGVEGIRLAALLLLTLRGTAIIYYGEEIGMRDVEIPADRVQDVRGLNVSGHNRDPARTPMPWDTSSHAGFSTVTPWLPVDSNWERHNVAGLTRDERSILHLYRRLIGLRKHHPALRLGTYRDVLPDHASCWVFTREADDSQLLIALNFTADDCVISVPGFSHGDMLLSSELDRSGTVDLSALCLRPYGGCIVALSAEA